MIKTVLEWIKSLFAERSYQDSVESFVASRNPTTTAEVEYWVRVHDERQRGWSL